MSKSKQDMTNVQAKKGIRQLSNADDAEQRISDASAEYIDQLVSGDAAKIQELAKELAELRRALRGSSEGPETDIAVGGLAAAEKAAAAGDRKGLMEGLRAAGRLALEVAQKIGTELAVAALKAAMGIK